MTEPVQTRDEPGGQVQARLQQLGIVDSLRTLPGHERKFVYEALEVAHKRDIADHDILAGARYLQDLADVRSKYNPSDPVAGVLRRAATALVHT